MVEETQPVRYKRSTIPNPPESSYFMYAGTGTTPLEIWGRIKGNPFGFVNRYNGWRFVVYDKKYPTYTIAFMMGGILYDEHETYESSSYKIMDINKAEELVISLIKKYEESKRM